MHLVTLRPMFVCVIKEPLASKQITPLTHNKPSLTSFISFHKQVPIHWIGLLLLVFTHVPLCTLHGSCHLPSFSFAQFDALDGSLSSSILNALSFHRHLIPSAWLHSPFAVVHCPTEGFSLSNGSAMIFSFSFGAFIAPHRVHHGRFIRRSRVNHHPCWTGSRLITPSWSLLLFFGSSDSSVLFIWLAIHAH